METGEKFLGKIGPRAALDLLRRVPKLFVRRATFGEMNICGGQVSQKNVLNFFRFGPLPKIIVRM